MLSNKILKKHKLKKVSSISDFEQICLNEKINLFSFEQGKDLILQCNLTSKQNETAFLWNISNKKYFIFYNHDKPLCEQLHAIGHELFHYLNNDQAESNKTKIEADRFALQLIAPAHYLCKNKMYRVYDLEHNLGFTNAVAANAIAELSIFLVKKLALVVSLLVFFIAIISFSGVMVAVKTTKQHSFVYITKSGNKYHKEDCRYLNDTMQKITLEKAIEKGYGACLVCEP